MAGRIESGTIKAGDEIVFLPSNKRNRIKTIESFNTLEKTESFAGQSTGFTLDTQIYIRPGEIVCRVNDKLPHVSSKFKANIFWMGNKHLEKGSKCLLKLTTQEVECAVESIVRVINSSTLEEIGEADLLLLMADTSHRYVREQIQVVQATLKDMQAEGIASLLLLNKADRPEAKAHLADLQHAYPEALVISALERQGLTTLKERMAALMKPLSNAPCLEHAGML